MKKSIKTAESSVVNHTFRHHTFHREFLQPEFGEVLDYKPSEQGKVTISKLLNETSCESQSMAANVDRRAEIQRDKIKTAPTNKKLVRIIKTSKLKIRKKVMQGQSETYSPDRKKVTIETPVNPTRNLTQLHSPVRQLSGKKAFVAQTVDMSNLSTDAKR